MAYEQMTPQERMQRAALLRAQREARLGYTPTVTEDLSRYLMSPTEQSVGSVAPVSAQRDDDTDALEAIGKGVATGLDLGANVAIGAAKSLEGIFDIGASLVGTVGGWFSEDFKREVEKVVAYQAVNELVENPLDELGLKHSYLNDSEIGEIIGGVAQGVGGMLPSVLVTVATGGTAAPVAVKQALSLGTMIAGAAGNASEEALNDGANLGQATNYGIVSGAIEGATEKLTGGASKWLIGKGLIKGAGNVAAQGGKRILKNMAGEAVEEGLATLVNPLAKTTYKGADALSEYGEAEFYGDVLRDAASGALVAGAFEQTVGRVAHRAGADADIYDAQEAIDNIVNKQRAEQAKGIYENGQLDADAMANLENISKALKKASPEKRAKLIERHDLSQAFTESGEIKPEFASRFDGGTTTPQDGTMGATQSRRGYNKAYYSADKRGSEAQIASEVESIQESLRNVERNRLEQNGLDPSGADNITVKVFDGELSEQGKKNLANAHGFINNVSDRTRTGMSMVVVDSDGAMNGVTLNDSNTIYIDASNIEDGTYLKTMVEEVAHFSEGTQSYGKLLSFIAEDEDLFSEVAGELVADGNGYGFTADTFLSLVEKSKAGNRQSLTGAEKSLANEIGAHMVAETFGNETFMQKVIKGEPTLAEKMIARVKALKNALSGNESAEARTERKRLEKAEKLWMKSVEDAGYKYIKGKLIKRRREKEEEEKKKATSSTENVQDTETLDNAEGEEYNGGAQFSRKRFTNEFNTNAMKWAFSVGTKKGDVNAFYDPNDNTWKKVVADDSGDGFDVLSSIDDTEENFDEINRMIKEGYRENNGREQDEGSLLYSDIKGYRSETRDSGDDNFGTQIYGADGQDGRSYRSQSQNNRRRASGQGVGVSSRSISYIRGPKEIVFKTMDKASCKKLVDRAFELAKRYGEVEDGKYKNSDEWLRDVGAFNAALVIEDTDEYKKGAMSEVRDLSSGEVSLSEVFQAYIDDELVGHSLYNTLQFSLPNRTTDAAYLKAVEDGDMETAQRMVDEAAKKAGYTVKAYHGTDNEFTVFNKNKIRSNTGGAFYGNGFYFSTSEHDANNYGKKIMPVYLRVGKTLNLDGSSWTYDLGIEEKKRKVKVEVVKTHIEKAPRGFVNLHYTTKDAPNVWKSISNVSPMQLTDDETGKKFAEKKLNPESSILPRDIKNLAELARSNGYDSIKGGGTNIGDVGIEYVLFDAENIKSADPVTYDDKGNVIPISKRFNVSDPDIRFSLPSKGGEAKKKAERSRSNSTQKYYLRDEISSAVDAIVAEQMNFGERHGVLDFQTKKKVVRQVWEKLNSASDDRERARIADELADYIIDSSVAQKVLSKEDSAYLASAKQLMRKLDLDGIKPQIAEKLGARTSVYAVWGKRHGGESISLADAKKMLAESGIELQATEDAEIFFEILDRYNEIKQWIRDESTIFKKSISAAELSETKKAITEDLLSFSEKNGSPANFSRMVEQYERRIDRLNSRLKEQYESARLIREVVFRADRLKKLQLGKMHNAAEFNPQEFRKTIGALGSIVRGGDLSVKKTREVSGKLSAWLRWHMKQIEARLAEDEGRKFELNKIVTYLDEIADPMQEGVPLSVDELKNLSYAMARLTTYASEYGKIIRNGKRIDALPIVEGYIDRSDKTRKIPRGAIRTFREWYIGKFADPATVMRYADGYDEHGFFTETFAEFREGAIKVEVTRMELMEDYVKFLDKHKKYSDHLREYVEYRGKRVPRNVLISLWMTTKRKQAQLGLVMEGAQFRAEPDTKAAKKNDDGTRVFDIAPFGDPMRDTKTDPYTDEEIETIMEGIRTEIEKSFTDTDRSYITMVEGIFKECGEIKRGVDMERLGYTNVDEKQYYFPIARADIAQTIEQESWQQGLDRVSHLSMNKDTVNGAHNRLYLSGVDAILARHVNQVSLYNGIATAVDNFNLLVNLKINEDGAAITVNNTVSRTDYGKAALDYLKKLKQDIERVNRVDLDDAGVTKFLSYLRGAYATSVLGANPKVWVTQASSLIAAGNVLDGKSIAEGMALKMGKVNGEDEVDIYCPLAKLRNDTNTAYEAQSVSARVPNALRKTSEFLMKPIGAVDRFVIERLWGACQVQVQSKGGAKVGTKENKVEAGKLLQKVILETQQNSLATERSSAMRSTNEIMKSVTMFSADAMKMIGRFFDAYGEASFIRQRLKDQTLSKTEREKLEARKKVVDKQVVKSTSVLLSSAVFMMAIAAAFKALLGQYEEKEPEEVALDMTADGVGNLLSGLPILRDVYSFYAEGYELNMNVITYVNGLMEAVGAFGTNIGDLTSGKEVTSQAWASSIRKGFFAGGQILGLPAKNVYKYATRVISLVSPETGYAIDAAFTKPSIKADLKKAIEAGDTKMVARIAEIATSENYGMYSESTRKELKPLVEAGYTVFPRTVGDTVTVDGETYELTDAQKKQFEKVYAVSDKAVEELVALRQYGSSTDEVKAKALKYVYDTYYSVALDDLMGTDTEQKSVLFAEVLDVELLAMVVAYVSTLTADKDKDGNTVNGSRKHKVVAYVNSLNLSAAEKYMIMGYLGYTNINGKNQVESLINRSHLSRAEKATLLAYSGY